MELAARFGVSALARPLIPRRWSGQRAPSGRATLPFLRRVFMANTDSRGRSQDRARVAGGQDHEVRYEANKTGASAQEVKDAVKDVGNSRKKVEDKLGR